MFVPILQPTSPPALVPAVASDRAVAAASKLDAFEIVCLVGKGGFGKVMLVRLASAAAASDATALYAMKVMKKDVLARRNALRDAQAERDILAVLGGKLDDDDGPCPFIVRLHAAFQSKSRLYLVMDFAAGGEIMWHLRQAAALSEEDARFYAAELLVALEYLHKRRILHRDIKPENVLLGADGHLLLTDFGLAKDLGGFEEDEEGGEGKRKHSWCGSEDYMAPEIIAREEHAGTPADWWAFGIFLFDCLVGHPPFSPLHEVPAGPENEKAEKKTRKRLHDRILKAKVKLPSFLTSQCHSLIRSLLTRNPDRRLTDPAAIRAHPWFRNVDWDAVGAKRMTPPIIPVQPDGAVAPTGCFSPSLTQGLNHSAPHSPLALAGSPTSTDVLAAMSAPMAVPIPVPNPSGSAPVAANDGVGIWEGFSFVAPGMEVHFELAAPSNGLAREHLSTAGSGVDGGQPKGQHQHHQIRASHSPLSSPPPPMCASFLPSLGPAALLHASVAASSHPGMPSTPPLLLTPLSSPRTSLFPAVELQLAAEVAEFSLDAEQAVKVKDEKDVTVPPGS